MTLRGAVTGSRHYAPAVCAGLAPARNRSRVEAPPYPGAGRRSPAGPALQAAATGPTNILPITINNILHNNGVLTAVGQIGNNVFTSPVSLGLAPSSSTTTPILHLRLDAIHLDLLGLTVDTSNICLAI